MHRAQQILVGAALVRQHQHVRRYAGALGEPGEVGRHGARDLAGELVGDVDRVLAEAVGQVGGLGGRPVRRGGVGGSGRGGYQGRGGEEQRGEAAEGEQQAEHADFGAGGRRSFIRRECAHRSHCPVPPSSFVHPPAALY
ncbi:hypothetical protein ACFW5P_14410 [Streptomyces rochei]|uniref:hypothetical protein n=1 Tax=Streptomyces rochei TaxID=1928 RepID=UPI0036BDC42D